MLPQEQFVSTEKTCWALSGFKPSKQIQLKIACALSSLARRLEAIVALAAVGLLLAGPAESADTPFSGPWILDKEASTLNFQSVKNNALVENNRFASYTGLIDEDGLATVKIQLDSIDTAIDLRNVRMRFLFFETYNFPEAIITARLDADALRDLKTRRRMPYKLKFEMELHGQKSELEADIMVTLISDRLVSVSSAVPIPIAVKLFGMEENVRKLEEAAKVTILPSGSVSFNFVFANAGIAGDELVVGALAPKETAVETKGNFTADACRGRFEILSRTGAIYFKTGSARIEPDSAPFLQAVSDIARRCPDLKILVSGHTDSDGDESLNQNLSDARADAVVDFLARIGIDSTQLRSIGYGESRPVVPNDTPRNRGLNRRIEFSVFDG